MKSAHRYRNVQTPSSLQAVDLQCCHVDLRMSRFERSGELVLSKKNDCQSSAAERYSTQMSSVSLDRTVAGRNARLLRKNQVQTVGKEIPSFQRGNIEFSMETNNAPRFGEQNIECSSSAR